MAPCIYSLRPWLLFGLLSLSKYVLGGSKPNILMIMTDDQGKSISISIHYF